jgi:hypothetical protein
MDCSVFIAGASLAPFWPTVFKMGHLFFALIGFVVNVYL